MFEIRIVDRVILMLMLVKWIVDRFVCFIVVSCFKINVVEKMRINVFVRLLINWMVRNVGRLVVVVILVLVSVFINRVVRN